MRRPAREFRTESFELEGRLLLAIAHASTPVKPPVVKFESATNSEPPSQVVMQEDGEATVTLSRSDAAGSLQVQVTTDPSAPEVGVNVGAVDQTVTFADGQRSAALTVPILSGAPNPGEVDVYLSATPVGVPSVAIPWSHLDLRIMSSDPTLPPTIVTRGSSPQRIVLTFSKPMNPVGVSRVKNYVVILDNENFGGTLGKWFGIGVSSSLEPVRLRSARYDRATLSVTLIPKGRLPRADLGVSHGHPAKNSKSARASVERRPSNQRPAGQPDQRPFDTRKGNACPDPN